MSEVQATDVLADPVDWENVELPRSKAKIDFLRLKSGNIYTVRLFSKPVPVNRYYFNERSAITADPINCPVKVRHPELKVKNRYGILVIDRKDTDAATAPTGKVKVMEAPAGVFTDIKEQLFISNNVNPGGRDAPDISIKVVGTGIKTRYHVTVSLAGPKPFTDGEKALLTQKRDNEGYNLQEIFKPHSSERIEEILFGGNAEDTAEESKPAKGGTTVTKDDADWA